MSELHTPPMVTIPAPVLNAPIRLRAESARHDLPPAKLRSFRRGFFDRKDPFESAGRLVQRFTFSNSYDLEGDSPQSAADEIQVKLHQQLVDGNLADTRLDLIEYDDAALTGEPARRFFVMHNTTRRKTVLTVNAYFQAYGDHLYYSVRSYILPVLSIWKLLFAAFITFSVLSFSIRMPTPFVTLVALLGLAFHLRKFIIDLLAGDTLEVALRKQYPGGLNSGTFDEDDATAFLKTNVSLTLSTIAAVLEKHGIDTGGLRMIIQRMEINNVSTNGGSIVGAAIGGLANRIAAEVRT